MYTIIWCILLGCLNNSFDQGFFHGGSNGCVGSLTTGVFVAAVLQYEGEQLLNVDTAASDSQCKLFSIDF